MTTETISEIEADLSRSRAQLRDNVQALSERLTIGRVVDDLIFDGQIDWSKFGGAAGGAAKLIVPGALIGAGVGMFLALKASQVDKPKTYHAGYDPYRDEEYERMYSAIETVERDYPRSDEEDDAAWRLRVRDHHARALGYTRNDDEDEHAFNQRLGRAVDQAKTAGRSARDRLMSAAGAIKHGVQNAASAVVHGVQGAASSASSAIGSAAGSVGHKAHGFASSVGDKAHDFAGAVGSSAGRFKDKAWDLYQQEKAMMERQAEKARDMYDSNPFLGVAIGLGVGALLGAALPLTRKEREVLSEPVNKAATRVADIGQQLADKAQTLTDKVADKAQEKLSTVGGQGAQSGQSGGYASPQPATF